MKRLIASILITFFLSVWGYGQDQGDLTQVSKLVEAAFAQKNYDKAIKLGEQVLARSSDGENPKILLVLAKSYQVKREYATSLNYFLRLERQYAKSNEENQQARVNTEVGNLYKEWGITEKAVDYYKNTYQIWKKLGNKDEQNAALSDLIILHQTLNEPQSVLKYSKELLTHYEAEQEEAGIL
ncbi:MAG: hypothetical protein AAF740_09050, partial [Bacteroidota bacterium]